MCIFEASDLIEPNTSAEAEALFQLGRAHDLSIIANQPDTIPPALRGKDDDRAVAKDYYYQAAQMGHTNAMNNLAIYLHNGWGHGDEFIEDRETAYKWNIEMARRGDANGYVGMASYLFAGTIGPVNRPKAVACLVAGAKLDHPRATRLLAQDDLGIRDLTAPAHAQIVRLERGVALLEELFRRGMADAYADLARFYDYRVEDLPKFEFYARQAAIAGSLNAKTALLGASLGNRLGPSSQDQALCIEKINDNDLAQLEAICPRPDGPLTREAVGLGPAPAAIGIPEFLIAFENQNPDLVP